MSPFLIPGMAAGDCVFREGGAIAGSMVELDLRSLSLKDLQRHGATVMPRSIFASLVKYVENQ